MFKQKTHEELFENRLPNTNNIEIIKKFFVLPQTTQTPAMKQFSSLMSKTKQITSTTHKKNNPKFAGGFQQCSKSVQNQDE